MAYITFNEETGNLMHGNVVIFNPCLNGLTAFCDRHNLSITKRYTIKTILHAISNDQCASIRSELLTVKYKLLNDMDTLAVLNDDTKEINKIVKKSGMIDICNNVYAQLKDRDINPTGNFDKGGRWYADNDMLINCRSPSRAWPYSQMYACRTLKYVKKCAVYFDCETEDQLLSAV